MIKLSCIEAEGKEEEGGKRASSFAKRPVASSD